MPTDGQASDLIKLYRSRVGELEAEVSILREELAALRGAIMIIHEQVAVERVCRDG